MEKCKLLRFFILCHCIILSVQIFGMDRANVHLAFDFWGVKCNKDNKKEKRVDSNARESEFNKISFYKRKLSPLKIFETLVIRSHTVQTKSGNTPILTIKFQPSTDDGEFYLKYTKNKEMLPLIKQILSIEKKDEDRREGGFYYSDEPDKELTISTKGGKELEQFKMRCKNLNISPSFVLSLCIPKSWKVSMKCDTANIIGNLSNPISSMFLNNCSVSLHGKSNGGAYYLTNSIFNKENNGNKLILYGGIMVKLKNSYFRCWADPKEGSKSYVHSGNYYIVSSPLRVDGHVDKNSTTCFDKLYTNNCAAYDKSSNRTYIPFKDCINLITNNL